MDALDAVHRGRLRVPLDRETRDDGEASLLRRPAGETALDCLPNAFAVDLMSAERPNTEKLSCIAEATHLQTHHRIVEGEDLENVSKPNLAGAVLTVSSQRSSADDTRIGACHVSSATQPLSFFLNIPDEMVSFES